MGKTGAGGPLVRFCVDQTLDGERLARAVARAGGVSSVREAKMLVDLGRVFLGDRRETRASAMVHQGVWVEVHRDRTRPVALDRRALVREGESLLAIHKPAGVPVAGGRGRTQTSVISLLEVLLKGEGSGGRRGRLQLVHRLDRDTSGLLLVARSSRARRDLEEQFLRRLVQKGYRVLVQGTPEQASFRRQAPVRARRPGGEGHGVGRAQGGGARVVSREDAGAVTDFQVLERFAGYALLEARPLTGRTHQIRIHLEQLGLPVLGDSVYGPAVCPDPLARAVPRQMLHAESLGFRDPDTGEAIVLHVPPPEDMARVLERLRARSASSGETG